MRPLIPRVQAGDILKGTRNLRNWLRLTSVLNYLSAIEHGGLSRDAAKGKLYTPSKEDTFLVTVNAWDMFGVQDASKPVTLLFINPVVANNPRPNRKAFPTRRPKIHRYMDPTLFSKWFIRTPQKMPNIDSWPLCSIFMWASIHLNMGHSKNDNSPVFHGQGGPESPFTLHQNGQGWSKDFLLEFIRNQVPRGITRQSLNYANGRLGSGPNLDEIPAMRLAIHKLCLNPRLHRQVKDINLGGAEYF